MGPLWQINFVFDVITSGRTISEAKGYSWKVSSQNLITCCLDRQIPERISSHHRKRKAY